MSSKKILQYIQKKGEFRYLYELDSGAWNGHRIFMMKSSVVSIIIRENIFLGRRLYALGTIRIDLQKDLENRNNSFGSVLLPVVCLTGTKSMRKILLNNFEDMRLLS